jgi:HSP20 family protein
MASRFKAPFGASRVPASWGDPFLNLNREVNRLFDDVFRGIGTRSSGSGTIAAPRIDIDETDQTIEISAELPGVSKDAVDITIDDDVLTISGEKRCERKDEQARVCERFYGSFQRAIQLPFPPDADEVQANFENGVLKITLPKHERPETARHIQIRSGETSTQSVRATKAQANNQQSAPPVGEADAGANIGA